MRFKAFSLWSIAMNTPRRLVSLRGGCTTEMPSPLQSWNNGSHWNLGNSKTLVCAILHYYYLLPCLCWKQLFRLLSVRNYDDGRSGCLDWSNNNNEWSRQKVCCMSLSVNHHSNISKGLMGNVRVTPTTLIISQAANERNAIISHSMAGLSPSVWNAYLMKLRLVRIWFLS